MEARVANHDLARGRKRDAQAEAADLPHDFHPPILDAIKLAGFSAGPNCAIAIHCKAFGVIEALANDAHLTVFDNRLVRLGKEQTAHLTVRVDMELSDSLQAYTPVGKAVNMVVLGN
jgi:hypothetical protein